MLRIRKKNQYFFWFIMTKQYSIMNLIFTSESGKAYFMVPFDLAGSRLQSEIKKQN